MISAIIGTIVIFYILKHLRRTHENPKYIPTSYLKRVWSSWKPEGSTAYRKSTGTSHLEPISGSDRNRRSRNPPSSFNAAAMRRAEGSGGVDRNTSVRSVMTLPAYNVDAGETEQVLGREGERGGIDVVIEHPESQVDAEALREQEMEALYQVSTCETN